MADSITKAREELLALGGAIDMAVNILRPHMDLIARYEQERRRMDNVGSIVDPTLFNKEERRATDAIMAPMYRSAAAFVQTFDIQMAAAQDALSKVKHHGR